MAAYLGIDVGTSSVKLTAIDDSGSVVATASQGYGLVEPRPGWREIDPETWWNAVCDAMVRLSASVEPSSIAGVCVTGQMHTVVLADEGGRATCRSIMWNDLRTSDDVPPARLAMRAAGESHIARIVSTGSPAINLAWARRFNPSAFEAAAVFLGVPDWIALRLGGHPGIDWCGASTSSLFSLDGLAWSLPACDYFGIPQGLLPAIEDSDSIIGTVCEKAALRTGLPVGIPIVRGTGDNPAAAIPTGCLSQSAPVISLGTSGVLMYARDGVCQPAYGKPVLVRAGERLRTLVQLTVKSCGSDMEWWVKRVLGLESFSPEDKAVEDLRHDMGDLLFFPHLNGEKVLYSDPSLRGAFLGLSLDTTASEMTRAVMEGVAFGLRSLWEVIEGPGSWDAVRLVGGGSKSNLWTSIVSNVLGVDVVRMRTSGAGQGAAILALCAVTGESLVDVAERAVELLDVVTPDAEICAVYDRKYARYERVYDALESVNNE